MSTGITITGGKLVRTDLMPADTLAHYNALNAEGDALLAAGDSEAAVGKWQAADKVAEPYTEEPTSPPPTAPDPPPPELIYDQDDAIAVCTCPDVCKSPSAPVPYMVCGKGGDDQDYASTVRSNGLIVKSAASSFTKTYGDEPGSGLGVKSGTVGSNVEPVTYSPVVFVEGQPLVRHHDKCTLNQGNCPGEYIHVKSTDVYPPPDGNDAADKSGWQSFKDQFWDKSETAQDVKGLWDKLGEYADDPWAIADDAKELYQSLPSGEEIWQGAQDIAAGAIDAGADILNDPAAAASAAGTWIKDQATGAWEEGKNVYNEDGAAGLAGAGLGVIGDIVSPSKKAKMAKRAAEAADELGDAARLERKLEKGKEKKGAGEKKATENGEPGARSTGIKRMDEHEVQCFKKGKGNKATNKEYDRQLADQEKALNQMNVEDFQKARELYKQRGRHPDAAKANQDFRASFQGKQEKKLREQKIAAGMSRSEAAAEAAKEAADMMKGLDALHTPDMIAAGHHVPTDMGSASANRSIGGQWPQNERIDGVDQAARAAEEKYGKDAKMNVKLKRCD